MKIVICFFFVSDDGDRIKYTFLRHEDRDGSCCHLITETESDTLSFAPKVGDNIVLFPRTW
jgi:hypothetical protein